jgi:hypothetical protein
MGKVTGVGYIDGNGVYRKGERSDLPHDRSTQYKDWDHTMQRKEFSREITQPRKNGKPNPEFIRSYPNYSKKYWTQEEIDKALREDMGGLI